MPRISTIEKTVSSLEGFNIKIRNMQGEEVKAKTFGRLAWVMGILGVLIVTFAVFKPFA